MTPNPITNNAAPSPTGGKINASPAEYVRTLIPRSRRALLLGLAGLALAGCASGPDLSRLADADVDFLAYRKFAFVPGTTEGHASLIERRWRAAARREMERRGYAFDEFSPDLLVNMAAVLEERQGLRARPTAHGEADAVETEDYRVGRLAIDLIDTRRQQVVWHGTAEGRVSAAMLRDTGTAVDTAVAAVFDGFSVRPGATATTTGSSCRSRSRGARY